MSVSYVEELVVSVLSTDSDLTQLVDPSNIRPPGNWQNLHRRFADINKPSYIIHFPVARQPLHTHDGLAVLNRWPFYQVSCISPTYRIARQVADAVVACLDGVHEDATFFLRDQRVVHDDERELVQIALDFAVAEAVGEEDR
mgnify:FL=1